MSQSSNKKFQTLRRAMKVLTAITKKRRLTNAEALVSHPGSASTDNRNSLHLWKSVNSKIRPVCKFWNSIKRIWENKYSTEAPYKTTPLTRPVAKFLPLEIDQCIRLIFWVRSGDLMETYRFTFYEIMSSLYGSSGNPMSSVVQYYEFAPRIFWNPTSSAVRYHMSFFDFARQELRSLSG